MASKIKKFKPKSRKGVTKRLSLSSPKDDSNIKIRVRRINHAHRLISSGKTGESKLKASRKTTVSSVHKKYLKVIAK